MFVVSIDPAILVIVKFLNYSFISEFLNHSNKRVTIKNHS